MSRSSILSIIYFALAIIGFLWSWSYFIEYFKTADSYMIGPFLQAVMETPASAGVAIDIYIAAIAFSLMVLTRASKDNVKWPWAYVAVCFLIGLCVALPVYFGMRERAFMRQ